jgi:hypothetical protein
MKIIISRKGFDGTAGGFPSPIFDDGSILSLPIPYEKGTNYEDICGARMNSGHIGKIVEDLTERSISGSMAAHLDPDLNHESISREPDWRGVFGQSSRSQCHLDKNNVRKGDLFLFFGLFHRVELDSEKRLRYIRGHLRKHVFFGWLRVDEKYSLPNKTNKELPLGDLPLWARYHPHVIYPELESKPNVIYTATDKLDLDMDVPGWGVFKKFSSELCLTHPNPPTDKKGKPKDLPSLWQLPPWMNPWKDPNQPRPPLTQYPSRNVWLGSDDKNAVLQTSKGYTGQESILDTRDYPEAWPWAKKLISTCNS